MPSPYAPNDADQVLADFGEDLVCSASTAVTRGLLDDEVVERDIQGNAAPQQIHVLRVKRGAFGAAKVADTTVRVVSRSQDYTIVGLVPRRSSLFDHYELRVVRTRSVAP